MGYELLTRLQKTGKYELAELATYGKPEDPRINYLPWKVYPVIPREGDAAEHQAFNSRPDAQFGSWKFEQVCLEFKPDCVLDFRDCQWMSTYQLTSPLRQYYSLLWMPTVDSFPQMDDWVNQYVMADKLLAYSNFGFNTLKKLVGEEKLGCVASPGVNMDDMRILDKKEIRSKYGLSQDINIIGMVARNQIRKLFPDLFKMFRLFLDKAPQELADKTFLHIHTGFPDQGWDIPRLLKECGLSHKVYFTYICRACGQVTISKWNDYKLNCKKCAAPGAVFFTNPAFGVDKKTLCEIYNLHDLYVQYAGLEGCGIPILEAAACGVPVCVVPFSAMEDFPVTLSAYPIKIAKYMCEDKSHRTWAFPDNENFAEELIKLMKPNLLKFWGEQTKELCKQHYNWDDSAKLWEITIDNMPPAKRKWDDPPLQEVPPNVDNNSPDHIFVRDCINNIGMAPFLSDGLMYNRFMRDLYNCSVQEGNHHVPYTRQNVVSTCEQIRQGILFWERERCRQSST